MINTRFYKKLNMGRVFGLIILLIAVASGNLSCFASTLPNNNNYSWVQYSNNGQLLFRYITTNKKETCPTIILQESLDNIIHTKKNNTTERIFKDYTKEFPIKICQAVFDPKKYQSLIFNNKSVVFPPLHPSELRASVVGDTGCLMSNSFQQNCFNPKEYPFPEIAKLVAQTEPDIIIHVGDYWYSSHPCTNPEKCEGRSYGDNWPTWESDFFTNSRPLLETAPIIFTRGNHEDCDRGGKGWAVLLDPDINFTKCQNQTQPYEVNIGEVKFIELDSSNAPDFKKQKEGQSQADLDNFWNKNVQSFIEQFNLIANKVKASPDSLNVLITHRPIFSFDKRPWATKSLETLVLNKTLQEAFDKSSISFIEDRVPIILSGHTHTPLLTTFRTQKGAITQIVSGNGGAEVNPCKIITKRGPKKIDDRKLTDSFNVPVHGFAILDFNHLGLDDSTTSEARSANLKFFNDNGKEIFERNLDLNE